LHLKIPVQLLSSAAGPECLSWILFFFHSGSRTLDPGFQIPDPTTKKWRGNKFVVFSLVCSNNFHKIENYFIFEQVQNFSSQLPKI
jgi:hypothetical protein